MNIRRAHERGHANHGWLDSYHSFSFADYFDQRHMGFRALRVINEDRVAPAKGFGTHPHRDMEIISYVLEGALQHRDSMGNGSTMRPGDVQRMSAGTGVLHSEFNGSTSELVHFLQIWIMPEKQGTAPGYEQKHFSAEEKRGRLRLVASRDGREGSVRVQQDVNLYASLLETGESLTITVARGRHAWIQLIKGELEVGEEQLKAGDALSTSQPETLVLKARSPLELLYFDLA
jgi:redox-sensitive bicupin YhaK (pirin superfamily)